MRRPRQFQLLVLAFVGLLAFGGYKVRSVRQEVDRKSCCVHLEGLRVFFNCYVRNHGELPAAFTTNDHGERVNSWRLEYCADEWYNSRLGRDNAKREVGPNQPPFDYDYKRRWNEGDNRAFDLDSDSWWLSDGYFLKCPASPFVLPAVTHFVAIVDERSMWPGSTGSKKGDGSDDDKILVIEYPSSDILWMEPRDLTLPEALDYYPSASAPHSDGFHYLTVGGEVRSLPEGVNRETLRNLIVRAPSDGT